MYPPKRSSSQVGTSRDRQGAVSGESALCVRRPLLTVAAYPLRPHPICILSAQVDRTAGRDAWYARIGCIVADFRCFEPCRKEV
jgi:hypothetical protein